MKRFFYIILYTLILLVVSCASTTTESIWVTSQGDCTRLWLSDTDPSLTYRWEGETFDSVAHGDGVLYIIDNDSIIDQLTGKAYYGAFDENDIITISDNEYYIGELAEEKFNGYGVYDKNGELFIGNFKESKPHGFATWYKNGKPYYIGMWSNGNFHGEGTLYKEDGSIKTGDWENGTLTQTFVDVDLNNGHYNGYVKNNKPDGIGKMEYADGSIYSGKWKEGKWDGEGIYQINDTIYIASVWINGILDGQTRINVPEFSYVGEYLEGYPHGLCHIDIPNTYTYFGYMGDGVRSGYGELTLRSGDSYKGDWKDNLFEGDGVYVYSQANAKYEGQWYQGLQDGIGYYQCPEFAYRGEWEDGWINGKGKMVFSNKDQYLGNFVENKFYGEGVYLFANGNKYDGEFINGKFNGLGSFFFANGDSYIGEFKDGEILGDGSLTIYENGNPITITANWPGNNRFPSKASILFSNGDVYEGELLNGLPTKNGKWTTEEAIENNESWADKANDFYKNHKNEFEKIVTTVTYVTIGVAVAATVTAAAVSVAATGGASTPVALVATSKVLATAATVLQYTNTTLYVGSVAASTASAAQDYRNAEDETEKSEIIKNTASDLTLDVAFAIAPKVAKSSTARAAKVALSRGVKTIGKKTVVTISQNKTFGKIINIVKGEKGVTEKRLVNSNRKHIKETVEKGKQKFKSLILENLVKRTKLYKNLQEILAKGPITLSDKELNALLENPKYLRAYIKTYTGDHKNFQEFFIRLSLGNKDQVKDILNNPYIRKYVDRSIRQSGEGSVHEWLMTKNFTSFLTDPKWGEDGPFLALALTKLVQSTERVMFKNGGRHPSSLAANSSESARFHQRLAEVIDSCSSKEELLIKVREFAKQELTEEAYQEFNQIFKTVFILNDK